MRIAFCAVLLAGAAAHAGSDDLTITSKHTTNGQPGETTTSYLGSDHVRMATGGGRETIIDLKSGVITTLDGNKKTWYVVTRQDMEDMAAKVQERLNSPEQKKRMEAMQGMANIANSIEVKKSGATRKVAGFKCEEWVITAGTVSTTKECVTTDLKYPEHAFDSYKAFTQKLASSMSAMQPARVGENMVDKMKAIKGYPVATSMTVEFMGNKRTTESEVTEVKRGAIPASAWEVPAGFSKIDNPMMKAFGNRGH
jgi:Domain of unknown function (DUF4412)